MRTKKPASKSNWTDPDDAPRLTEEWFKVAEIRQAEKLVRTTRPVGCPKTERPKASAAGSFPLSNNKLSR
jgi:hypothetical protein